MEAPTTCWLSSRTRKGFSVWIRIPSTCSPSAPEPADSISASNWRCQLLASSASLRGKLSAVKSWRSEWKKGRWMTRLSGRIFEPSTAARGAASWIASLRDSRANHSPAPARKPALTTRGISGPMCSASSAKPSRRSCFSKTSPAYSLFDAPTDAPLRNWSSTNWRTLVSNLRRDCSRRLKLARRNDDPDSSSSEWPTPAGTMTAGEHLNAEWTPGQKPRKIGGRFLQTALTTCALIWSYRWLDDLLPGQTKSRSGNDSLPLTRRLNPRFVEWLMGWPHGWTDCGQSATESFQRWQNSHGVRSHSVLAKDKRSEREKELDEHLHDCLTMLETLREDCPKSFRRVLRKMDCFEGTARDAIDGLARHLDTADECDAARH